MAGAKSRDKNADTLTNRLAATGQMLVRSAMEIGHTLEAVRSGAVPLSASLREGEVLFLSRLLRVDPQGRRIVVACSDVKQANSELFASPSVTFGCNHEGIHYEFTVGMPREAEHEGAAAIELSFPDALLALQRRRSAKRPPLPPKVPVPCEVRLGPLSFDASIVDVGLDGFAVLFYDAAIRIDPGARLEGVRVMRSARRALTFDLTVDQVSRTTGNDGKPADQARCRIDGLRGDLEELIRLFLTDLP